MSLYDQTVRVLIIDAELGAWLVLITQEEHASRIRCQTRRWIIWTSLRLYHCSGITHTFLESNRGVRSFLGLSWEKMAVESCSSVNPLCCQMVAPVIAHPVHRNLIVLLWCGKNADISRRPPCVR
jgi:hypothetical protein